MTVNLEIGDADKINGNFVHQLAARKRIQDLEEDTDRPKDLIEQAIIKLGLEYKLASKFTSFIGVDTSEAGMSKHYAPMQARDVANQIPAGFGGGGMQYRCPQQQCAPAAASMVVSTAYIIFLSSKMHGNLGYNFNGYQSILLEASSCLVTLCFPLSPFDFLGRKYFALHAGITFKNMFVHFGFLLVPMKILTIQFFTNFMYLCLYVFLLF